MNNTKQVILIGKFSKVIEEFMARLEPLCQVQLCPINEQILKSLLETMTPKLFFFIFPTEGSVSNSNEILAILLSKCPDTPVIIIGRSRDEDMLTGAGYLLRKNVRFLPQPIDMNKVEQYIRAIMSDKSISSVNAGAKDAQDRQRTVMLVDDSPQFIYSMQRILTKRYKVTFVTSGLDVLPAIAKNRPDIILLDYEMPVCNGRQTLEILRSDDIAKDIPVIFLSGVADKKNVMDVMPLGPQGYMLKSSCTEGRLFEIIENVFGKAQTVDRRKK